MLEENSDIEDGFDDDLKEQITDSNSTEERDNDTPTTSHQSEVKKDDFCDICLKTFHSKYYLKEHQMIHKGIKPYNCHLCSRSFTQLKNLQTHIKLHSGRKRYACDHCDKKFSQRVGLKQHLVVHTGEKAFACTVCNTRFSQRGSLQEHMLRHTGERPYTCDICYKSYRQRSVLAVHLRTHSGKKNFMCSICDKGFSQKGQLLTHLRVHKRQKEHICPTCDENFELPHQLGNHLRKHTRENMMRQCEPVEMKPDKVEDDGVFGVDLDGTGYFSCSACKKSFTNVVDLGNHHCPMKKKAQDVAVGSFKQSGTPRTYLRVHREGKKHVCEVCKKEFSQEGSLKIHICMLKVDVVDV